MLARRLVASLWIEEPALTEEAARCACADGADEIMLLLDDPAGTSTLASVIESTARQACLPVTACLPTSSFSDFETLVRAGAERVYLDDVTEPNLLNQAAAAFGRQIVGIAVDLIAGNAGEAPAWAIRMHGARQPIAANTLAELAARGAGELLVRLVGVEPCAAALAIRTAARAAATEALRCLLLEAEADGLVWNPPWMPGMTSLLQLKQYLAAAGFVVRGG